MIPIVLILSFFLEIIFSNIIPFTSLLVPLFLVVSIVIVYPYSKSKLYFVIICFICGLIYDLGFFNTVFVNTLCFTAIGLLIIFLHTYINYNLVSTSIVTVIIIVLYRLISYLLLCLTAYTNFYVDTLFRGIYSSLIINVIYGISIYLLLEFISRRFNIKKNE